MKRKNGLYIAGLLFLLSACYKNSLEELEKPGDCDIRNISYERNIRPLISMSCNMSGCHNAGTAETFPLVTYEQLRSEAINGLLLKSINHEPGVVAMPKAISKLSDCNIAKITAWIAAGTPNN